MRADRAKLELAMARACMNTSDVIRETEMPKPTFINVITGRSVRPATLGRVAKALGVDVTELLAKEGA